MSSTARSEWQAIGPLWSNWGWKTWNLILEPHQLTAWPYTTWETVRLAFSMQLGISADPGAQVRDGIVDRRDGERLFPVSELQSITVEVRHGSNRVTLTRLGGARDSFFILHRHLTREWMSILNDSYPSLYAETGVPKTTAGRVLKW